MGEKPKKYHVTDEGDVYRVNEDGSFTSMGSIEDIEKRPPLPPVNNMPPPILPMVNTSSDVELGWWMRNYSWLWLTTLAIYIGWFISCLSCAWPEYSVYENGYVNYYVADNMGYIIEVSAAILFCYCLSWYLSTKNKTWLKLIQIPLVGCASCVACLICWLCEQEYSFLLVCIATIPFSLWFITLCLSIFNRR